MEAGHMGNPALVRQGEARRARMLAFIREFVASHGFAPSLHEIGADVELSTNAVRNHLKRLERERHIRCATASPEPFRSWGSRVEPGLPPRGARETDSPLTDPSKMLVGNFSTPR